MPIEEDIPADILGAFAEGPMRAKAILGWMVARDYHDEAEANRAAREWIKVHIRKELPDEIPTFKLGYHAVQAALLLVDLGWKESTTKARADIKGGALSIDGEKVLSQNDIIIPRTGMIVRLGKKKIVRLEVEPTTPEEPR